MLAHEALDLLHTAEIDPWRDVDQDERSEQRRRAFRVRGAICEQGGNTAEGGADRNRRPGATAQPLGNGANVGGKIEKAIGAFGAPVGVAVTALVERAGGHAAARDPLGSLLPGMTCLSAAMQQQHRPTLTAEDIGLEGVSVGTGERRGDRNQMPHHGRPARKSSTAALNTRSPTASM